MDTLKLKADVTSAMEEYTSAPEAWEDAVLTVDPATGDVKLIEAEEAESLPEESIDIWNPMDLIEMTPEGAWKADLAGIDSLVEEYE